MNLSKLASIAGRIIRESTHWPIDIRYDIIAGYFMQVGDYTQNLTNESRK
jgi:hypothetical protein